MKADFRTAISFLLFGLALLLIYGSKIAARAPNAEEDSITAIALIRAALITVPFIWMAAIFAHREVKLGMSLLWSLFEWFVLSSMILLMNYLPSISIKPATLLPDSSMYPLLLGFAGVALMATAGRGAMRIFFESKDRHFFRPLVPANVTSVVDYSAIFSLSLAVFLVIAIKG